jgi:regulator of sigma E protease
MNIAIALIGLGFLILVHEAGHFFASLAVGLRPRRFYVGFPPAIAKTTRRGIEYGLGAIPLGGFVSIPGMHRPIPHDAERRFGRAVSEDPSLTGPYDRVRRGLDGADPHDALPALDEFEAALEPRDVSREARKSAEKGLTELRDGLGSDAYWKAPTWKRLVAIFAGPAANILLAIGLLFALYVTNGKTVPVVASVVEGSRADQIGLQPGDRVLVVDGATIQRAADIPDRISGSDGRKIAVVVLRDGQERTLGPIAPERAENGSYRLGFALDAVGLGPLGALGRSFEVTWLVTEETVKSIGRLAFGEGREDVASPIGITDFSAQAVDQGTESYLLVLALVSLSLALLNLLPLLPLDGGHILFALLEGARGRNMRREVYERVSVIGIALVLLLFFIGVSNDIGRLS